jgi:heme/copper-type cytochrome/quinol oxidase subunit 3
MTRLTLPFICECLLLCIPLNIYVIGDNLAQGVQWALFRYQQSSQGNSLILIHKDVHYVIGGILRGASATSTIIWVIGAVLLVAAVLILATAAAQDNPGLVRPAGILTIACGALFFFAELVEYGPVLANSHGSSVPVGIPVIIVVGLWLACGNFTTPEENSGEPDECAGPESDGTKG